MARRMLLGLTLAITTASPCALAQDWPMFGGNVQSTSANLQPTGITAANVGQLRHRRVELDGLVDASAVYLHGANIGKRVARLPCGSGHWNSPIAVDGKIILPEGNANRRSTRGVLDIWYAAKP